MWAQPSLHSEFLASQGYIVRPHLNVDDGDTKGLETPWGGGVCHL